MKKILFVEDNDEYRKTLTKILEENNYRVTAVSSALDAIEKLTFESFSLIISDLMMDGVNGIEFLTLAKKMNTEVKTVILTGERTNETELQALNIHIDKYIEKQDSIELILKHIEVLLETAGKPNEDTSHLLFSSDGKIVIDLDGFSVKREGQEVKVTPKEFRIIKLLLENKGKALSREEIISVVWDNVKEEIDIRVIDVHMKSIRKKLNAQTIVAVRGYGYKWD